MVEKRTPPQPKPKPIRPKNGKSTTNDAPAIAVDEVSAKEIMTEILATVGEEAGKIVCEKIHPGTGRIFSLVFNWVINLIRRMIRNNGSREKETTSVEDEQEQEQEDDTLKAEEEC